MATSETPSSYYLRWGPRMLREAVNNLVNLVCKIQPLAGDGLIRQDGPLGRSFSVVLPESSGQSVLDHPFQIIKQSLTFGSTSYTQIGVTSNSHLFNSEDKDTHEEENFDWGLLGDDNDQFDFNWIYTDALVPGDKIWLQITLSEEDQSITSIDLRYGFVGGDGNWPYYPDPIEINTTDNPYQQFYHQIIGEVTYFSEDPRSTDVTWGTDENKLQITQLLHTNLMMTTAHTTADADEADLPLLVAIPWNGPGTSVDGIADEINSSDDLMTPWALGPVAEGGSTVAFSVVDVSSGDDLRVKVLDGHVNFEYPSGMGFDNYTLAVSSSSTVYLIITYNQTTLEITSRTLAIAASVPDSVAGTVRIELADVTVTDDGLEIEQQHEGNINMALIYGGFNGAPAIIPLRALSNWAAVT